jgi:phosphoribosyl 1,2-cyclic phosphodiesterase
MPAKPLKQMHLFEQTTQMLLPLSIDPAAISKNISTLSHVGFCVLGSGSSGNCSVVECAGKLLLLDIGLGPRTVRRRLAAVGQSLDHVVAICLTHVDGDHFNPLWISFLLDRHAKGHAVRLFVHQRHVHAVYRAEHAPLLQRLGLIHTIDHRTFEPVEYKKSHTENPTPDTDPPIRIEPVSLPHDVNGSQGFLINIGPFSIGYATDLGSVPDELIYAFTGVHLLAIESNYDHQMQLDSSRTLHTKRRIMGPRGHLSNDQSFAAVQAILDRAHPHTPQHVVLLHRSQQCNHPKLLRDLFEQDARIKNKLILSDQNEPTAWLQITKID